uniref:Uncharacterized protein n=1 Tax=Candidatus Kentrum sp. MB TaxID=2138164 RepID=A0A450Y2F3_9GAMM|nr:MAG: hypothetical protein BECKMB1821I_GA0114274_11413 [Candidatus Kentron sp. MB]VFK77342.1 MAG: hypothetical protein BECKMB1821H_GA0114242_11263 [Candidatus Kentron sp. MB]
MLIKKISQDAVSKHPIGISLQNQTVQSFNNPKDGFLMRIGDNIYRLHRQAVVYSYKIL